MRIEYLLLGILFLLSLSNLIIYRRKNNLIKFIISLFISLLYLGFLFIDSIKPYIFYYNVLLILTIIVMSLLYLPKKITENLTQYDYFLLDKKYKDEIKEKDKLRQRYLKTLDLLDEGIIFYERDNTTLILSDKAKEILGIDNNIQITDYIEMIHEDERIIYQKTIDRVSRRIPTYDIKYKLLTPNNKWVWIHERGSYIGVDSNKSIISSIISLSINGFRETRYLSINNILSGERLFEYLRELNVNNKSYSLIAFELINIPDINERHSREVGDLLMNAYLSYIKNSYLETERHLYRITGIKYILIIENLDKYNELIKSLESRSSILYNLSIPVDNTKEYAKAKYGIIKVRGNKNINVLEEKKVVLTALEYSKTLNKKDYIVYNE